MDRSENIETENVSRKRRLQIVGTHAIIEGLQEAQRRPSEIGSVALPHELREGYIGVVRHVEGFNMAGDFTSVDLPDDAA